METIICDACKNLIKRVVPKKSTPWWKRNKLEDKADSFCGVYLEEGKNRNPSKKIDWEAQKSYFQLCPNCYLELLKFLGGNDNLL